MEVNAPTETLFIRQGIDADVRSDGRGRCDWRPFRIEQRCLPHAAGSARIHMHAGTDVVVGVRADIDVPDVAKPAHGKVLCSVDW